VVICLEQGADLHMTQRIPLSLTVSCFSKIQIGFTFLVLAYLGSPGQRAVKRVYVCIDAVSFIHCRPLNGCMYVCMYVRIDAVSFIHCRYGQLGVGDDKGWCTVKYSISHTHTQPSSGPLSGTTWVSRYQKKIFTYSQP